MSSNEYSIWRKRKCQNAITNEVVWDHKAIRHSDGLLDSEHPTDHNHEMGHIKREREPSEWFEAVPRKQFLCSAWRKTLVFGWLRPSLITGSAGAQAEEKPGKACGEPQFAQRVPHENTVKRGRLLWLPKDVVPAQADDYRQPTGNPSGHLIFDREVELSPTQNTADDSGYETDDVLSSRQVIPREWPPHLFVWVHCQVLRVWQNISEGRTDARNHSDYNR